MRIVVISPFFAERVALEALLAAEGHDLVGATTRAEGLRLARRTRAEVVIADAQVLGFDGLALVRALAELPRPPRAILLCPRTNRTIMRHGVVCLAKPIDLAELHRHLRRAPEALLA